MEGADSCQPDTQGAFRLSNHFCQQSDQHTSIATNDTGKSCSVRCTWLAVSAGWRKADIITPLKFCSVWPTSQVTRPPMRVTSKRQPVQSKLGRGKNFPSSRLLCFVKSIVREGAIQARARTCKDLCSKVIQDSRKDDKLFFGCDLSRCQLCRRCCCTEELGAAGRYRRGRPLCDRQGASRPCQVFFYLLYRISTSLDLLPRCRTL